MPPTFLTLAQLEANALAAFRTRFPDKDTSPESVYGKEASALAALLWDFEQRAQSVSRNVPPQDDSDYDALANWAFDFGLSDGDGGYGPKVATVATGLEGTATGTPGSPIADGTVLIANDGVTLFAVDGAVVVGVGGTVTVAFNATTTGIAGNLEAGDTVQFVSPPGGVAATVTVTTGATNGTDKEEKGALLTRLLGYLQNPPRAITPHDIRSIVEGISGIDRCYVYPLRGGSGTFFAVATQAGTGQTRRAATAYITEAQETIDEDRNVTVEEAIVSQPYMPNGQGKAIVLRVTPASTAFAFDWSSFSGAFNVAVYAAGPPAIITLNAAAPADLQAAIAAYIAGTRTDPPKLQIQTTGVVLPQQIGVVAYNAGTFACTLDDLPDDWTVPTVGDLIFGGGPVVDTIAQDVLDLVDDLGPSTESGYNDTASDFWISTLYIDQLRRVALDATDEDGTRMIVAFPTAPTIDGVATDVSATDTGINAPGMIYASSILVTP
jgi:uncharacterized phage protein gp47/JayE